MQAEAAANQRVEAPMARAREPDDGGDEPADGPGNQEQAEDPEEIRGLVDGEHVLGEDGRRSKHL
jgi:hypothetical protein